MSPDHRSPAPRAPRFAILILAAGILGAALARVTAAEPDPDVSKAAPPVAVAAEPRRSLPPWMVEIRAALAEGASRVERAQKSARAAGRLEALERERAVERAKLGTEIEVLRIQVRWARRLGREDAARHMESAIQALVTPPTVGDPSRPALRDASGAPVAR